jgi:hypothetical protein
VTYLLGKPRIVARKIGSKIMSFEVGIENIAV